MRPTGLPVRACVCTCMNHLGFNSPCTPGPSCRIQLLQRMRGPSERACPPCVSSVRCPVQGHSTQRATTQVCAHCQPALAHMRQLPGQNCHWSLSEALCALNRAPSAHNPHTAPTQFASQHTTPRPSRQPAARLANPPSFALPHGGANHVAPFHQKRDVRARLLRARAR